MFKHGAHKPHGVVICTTLDGLDVELDTRQCVHCGGHWEVIKGSGRPHIFCSKCGGDTCSNLKCLTECYPIQKKFDDVEKYGRQIIVP